jgi:hypothetical protein
MPSPFTDAELLAFLDEGLPVDRMTAVESALRQSVELQKRVAALRNQREIAGHSVGEIWRRARLTCPTRHELGSYLLGALPAELAQYIRFHLQTIGCRYCAANVDDLKQATQPAASETAQRRQKFFQSSAGHIRRLAPGE